jgi:DNA polymerase
LRLAVRDCTACALHQGRTQTVFGVGAESARWMIVGEAPGAEEDRQGEPFVGPAGQLLNEMLRAVGLARDAVFIANILKCRPPDNRDPRPEEVAACAGHLAAQIRLVGPQLILAVGRVAAQNLLQQAVPVGRLRGRVHHYGAAAIPLVVTYHPAYLLRSPAEKRKAWDDLRLARATVDPRGA